MASNYPGALDGLATDYEGTDQADVVDHAGMHNDVNAALNAVQTELGTDPSGAAATVKARFEAAEAALPSALLTTKGDMLARGASGPVRLPVDTDGRVMQTDSTTAAGVAWKPLGNLARLNVATGTDAMSDATGFTATGATVASSTEQALEGSRSAKFTANAAGATARQWMGGDASSGAIPVLGGAPFTVTLGLRAGSGSRSFSVIVYWWTSAGNVAASTASVTAATVAANDAGWTVTTAAAQAPANAAFASIRVSSTETQIGDVWYSDRIGYWVGYGGMWVASGQPPNMGILMAETATSGRTCYVWDQVNNRPQMVYYDSGWRDISGLLVNGWAGSVFLRRTDNLVLLRFASLSGAAATSDTVLTVPSGFRAESATSWPVLANASDATVARLTMTAGFAVTLPRATVTSLSTTIPYSTTNGLTATLPGSASGTIPAA